MGLPDYIQIKLSNLDLGGTNQYHLLTVAFAEDVFGAKEYIIKLSCLVRLYSFKIFYLEFILLW